LLKQQGLGVISPTARKMGLSSRIEALQKACTPASARRPLRASLITFVSTKYIVCPVGFCQSLKIGIQTYIGHGSKHVRQIAAWWAQERSGKDRPQFRLLADAMVAGTFLERLHEAFVYAADQQVGHGTPQILLGGASQEFQLQGVLPLSDSRLSTSLTSSRQTLSPPNDRLVLGLKWPLPDAKYLLCS
jgi:hypothetical protein